MKQTVSLNTFRNAFQAVRPDNFSYEGLATLFDYLEQWEDEANEELELDVIALCCDFSEDTANNIAYSYSIDIEGMDNDEAFETVKAYLEDEGCYIGEGGSDTADRTAIVYRQF